MPRGKVQAEQGAARYKRYCELRDNGMYMTEALLEVGLTVRPSHPYERAYRRLRNIPPNRPLQRFDHYPYRTP